MYSWLYNEIKNLNMKKRFIMTSWLKWVEIDQIIESYLVMVLESNWEFLVHKGVLTWNEAVIAKVTSYTRSHGCPLDGRNTVIR